MELQADPRPSTPGAAQAAFCSALVDEWTRAGVTDAIVSPGSRSTPMALALAQAAERGDLRLHVRLDERSAAWIAVGLALGTGRPAVVLATSGTASAESHPAVIEADLAGVPMIVCTSDRPPELRRVGAPQTIVQDALYGSATRWAFDPGPPEWETASTWRSLAARCVAEATAGPAGPGPVQLNLPFRDPLVASAGPVPAGRSGGRPWHAVRATPPGPDPGLVDELSAGGRRGIVVAGTGAGDPVAVHALASALGWPLLADPRSGARLDRPHTVAGADVFLRNASAARALRPEIVLRLGDPWASKVLNAWLGELDAEQIAVDPTLRWVDPERTAGTLAHCDPTLLCASVVEGAHDGRASAGPVAGWLGAWQLAERVTQQALSDVFESRDEPVEPGVARRLWKWLGPDDRLFVASSMPVRDLEWYAPPVPAPPAVLANRGANGIDGLISTVLGVALSASGGRVVGLLGDLAFFHDAGALLGAQELIGGADVTLVVVDNAGGGIFSFLPQASSVPEARYERLFGTPQAADVVAVAAGYGAEAHDLSGTAGLEKALGSGGKGLRVLRVRSDRATNVTDHAALEAAVSEAVDRAMGPA